MITIILNYLALKENKHAINNIETIEEFEKNHTKIKINNSSVIKNKKY
jgi:hypothetical protein